MDPSGENPLLLGALVFIGLSEWLNATSVAEPPRDDVPPTSLLLPVKVGFKCKSYIKINYHSPHNYMGHHIHWGPRRNLSPKAPRKWHFGPKNPNFGKRKGESNWSWIDWWKGGKTWAWK